MTKIGSRGETVRRFIIDNVERYPKDISRVTEAKFGVSRQAVNLHLHRLVNEGALTSAGATRRRSYSLAPLVEWTKDYPVSDDPAEDQVWREDVAPSLNQMAQNVTGIWQYGFTEMFNNAFEHSEGTNITVRVEKTAASTVLSVSDNGVGIFKKIQAALGLLDERHSVLELAKGKFTTDPRHHSGEGIFFASRMFDGFVIISGEVFFTHSHDSVEDWVFESGKTSSGTTVFMLLSNHTSRTTRRVFDKFASEDDKYGFTKTVVPVWMTKYGDDNLVSRSQARRLLARVDRFKRVMLDFTGVDSIGQAFADEVFRVFPLLHPEVTVVETNANSAVKKMIGRARSAS